MIYLASPYSHENKRVEEQRFHNVLAKLSEFAQEGLHAYSPIAHWHPVAMRHQLPTDFEYFRSINESMIKRCDYVVVLTLDGWEISRGVTHEMSFAQANNIPLLTVHPNPGSSIMVLWDHGR